MLALMLSGALLSTSVAYAQDGLGEDSYTEQGEAGPPGSEEDPGGESISEEENDSFNDEGNAGVKKLVLKMRKMEAVKVPRKPAQTIRQRPVLEPAQTIRQRPVLEPVQTIRQRPVLKPAQTIKQRPVLEPVQTMEQKPVLKMTQKNQMQWKL